jgi:beta-N-acetylhexosaminidase
VAIKAFISGCAGLSLSQKELAFFEQHDPWGLILFKRNCETPDQIRALVASFRRAVKRSDAPVFIDQEGGRVQRIGPPIWRKYPEARAFGKLFAINPGLALRSARHAGLLMAEELYELDITASCLPVLDAPQFGAHDVIGNRAYDNRPERIMALARAHMGGLMDGGVLPVMKHLPGHGRALVDSHLHLPIVEASRIDLEAHDFVPFTGFADCPMGMTAHVVYKSIDADHPATLSRKMVRNVIRKVIGFNGLLMTDDLSMKALKGTFQEKAALAYDAGCDMLLHCNGEMAEMEEVAAHAAIFNAKTARRAKGALRLRRKPQAYDQKQALRDLEALFAT